MPTSPALIADRYRLCRLLGYGGMGRVWLAHDEVLHRDVAAKEIIPPHGLTDEEREELRLRTLREARTAARLSHPNVVRIYDTVNVEERPWIVMEYVPSRSLYQVVNTDGPLSPQRAAKLGLAVLAALRAAHEAGVLHRDIKPGNVLIADRGRVVLTDFGLATFDGPGSDSLQLTRTGLILGSPQYIAPERARDGLSLPESDLWSLGATLYAAVEGRSPYARSSAMATLTALATEDPDPALNAGPLKPVLDALLRKDPKQRATIAQTERLLRHALAKDQQASATRSTKLLPRQRKTPDGPASAEQPVAEPAEAVAVTAVSPIVPPKPNPVIPREPARATAAPGTSPAVQASPSGVSVKPRRNPLRVKPPRPLSPGDSSLAERSSPDRFGWLRTRSGLLAALVAAVVTLGIVVVVALQAFGGEDESPAGKTAAPSGQASQPTSPDASSPQSGGGGAQAGELPQGWRQYQDQTGFSVAAPTGWAISREGTMVYFREPGGRVFGIDQTDQPKPDPVADWTAQEANRSGGLANYQRIKIQSVNYFQTAADWEYVYGWGSGQLHVVIRGFVVSSSKAYGIFWLTPEAQWQASYPLFEAVCRSFRPAG